MELEFSTKQMTGAMKAVKKMFDKGPFSDAAPSDDCLVASVDNGTALLESAAGGLYTKVTFPANVKEEGRVAISRSALHALKLQGERCTFSHRPGTNVMRFKSGQFVGEMSVGEAFEQIEAARPASIPKLKLSMPALVAKAAAKRTCISPTIDMVMRMKLKVEGRRMTLSCNDPFRAAAVRSNLDDDSQGEGEIDVPAVFFNTVLQAIEDSQVHLGFNDKVFRISGGGFDVCHPVMQKPEKPMTDVFARFEAFKQEEPVVTATIDASAMREAVASVASVAPVGSGDVRIELAFSDKNGGQVSAGVKSATSKGSFSIGVRSLRLGSKAPVTISAKYLNEMFSLMATDEADFYAWERAVVLQSEKVGCCMIMPQLKQRD